jgi:hypothetical protein
MMTKTTIITAVIAAGILAAAIARLKLSKTKLDNYSTFCGAISFGCLSIASGDIPGLDKSLFATFGFIFGTWLAVLTNKLPAVRNIP